MSKLKAHGPSFDLLGPKSRCTRETGEITLPIAQVPNLLPGDRLWIHPDLPATQSARYVLVVAFLRGVTNPPPASWFTRVGFETWTKEARAEGVFITVPGRGSAGNPVPGAPKPAAISSTLRASVRGRPGIFVRATQDLQSASLDRMRLDAYLEEVKVTSQTDPKSLKDRAERAARSLGVRAGSAVLRQADGTAGAVPDAAHGRIGAGRFECLESCVAVDQRIERRPDEPARLFANYRCRWLQPLHWRDCGYGKDPGVAPHRALSIHSSSRPSDQGYSELAS